MQRRTDRDFRILALLVLLLAVGGGWVGDSLATLLSIPLSRFPFPWGTVILAILGLFVFFGSAGDLYRRRSSFLPIRVLEKTTHILPRRTLILLVSKPNFHLDQAWKTLTVQNESIELSYNIEQDASARGARWNWQQLLRALRPHLPRLERIWLIGSPGEKGSHPDLPLCQEFLRKYRELSGLEIVPYPDPVDFEDLDALRNAFARILKEEKKKGFSEKDVVIDATGGPKTASIAAALFTTHHPDLTFQYVTNDGNVLSFNVIAFAPGEIG